ncbi:unnamed protein product [Spirodela intermedia]|uniref:Uncharacterized protein n=1 Tax=Spirodela intermedia TaxID=51605 RepID=A0A7I8L7K0_SPIIN|nr:unnamed protein product [Spirodela intermedia]
MDVPTVLFMNVGEGETSYAKNSSVQKEIIEGAWSITVEAVLNLVSATNNDKLSIADLGCSSGKNTLLVMGKIVDTVEAACQRPGRPPPEFQLFLNDLPGNDWNGVFCSLATYNNLRLDKDLGRCYVAGVAGSFNGRLFPANSINFFHSSCSLHWLSQDPFKAISQDNKPLLNKSINISEISLSYILDTYKMQFKHDFSDCLRFRAIEIVVGGHIGFVEEDKVDSFNLPFYSPSIKECLKVFEVDANVNNTELSSDTSGSQTIAKTIQAASEPILASHFGSTIIESLFFRFAKALEEDTTRNQFNFTNITISLARKT